MDQRDREIDQRLASIESHLAELGSALAESMVVQAEFMTWAARNTTLAVPKMAAQAVEFSQRMLNEASSINDSHKAFVLIMKARQVAGSAS